MNAGTSLKIEINPHMDTDNIKKLMNRYIKKLKKAKKKIYGFHVDRKTKNKLDQDSILGHIYCYSDIPVYSDSTIENTILILTELDGIERAIERLEDENP